MEAMFWFDNYVASNPSYIQSLLIKLSPTSADQIGQDWEMKAHDWSKFSQSEPIEFFNDRLSGSVHKKCTYFLYQF